MTASAAAHREEEEDTDPHVAALNALSVLVEQANAAVAAVPAGAAKPAVVVRLSISMLEKPMSNAAKQLSSIATQVSPVSRTRVTSSVHKWSLALLHSQFHHKSFAATPLLHLVSISLKSLFLLKVNV